MLGILKQIFPPKPQFLVENVPDLTGKVIIVTGGSSGIGKETVKALLIHNAKVYLLARNEEKARQAIEELMAETNGKEAIWIPLNLASLQSVKSAAETFLSQEKKLHILINNAASIVSSAGLITQDGYDLQFGTNTLGPFYLTKLLLPTLLSTSTPEEKTRVVSLSSITSHVAGSIFGSGLDFETFKDSPKRRKMAKHLLYAQSKFGVLVFAQELARRHADKIVSLAVNPGNLKTFFVSTVGFLEWIVISPFLYHPSFGALTELYAATSPEAANLNGKYIIPWGRVSNPRSDDPELGAKLWAWLEDQIIDI